MRVYFDTGVFIDFLSTRGLTAFLRSTARRGRKPRELAKAAERLFEKVARAHVGGTSCLTYYEVEEAVYQSLAPTTRGVSQASVMLVPLARSVAIQLDTVVNYFRMPSLDLTLATIRLQLGHLILQTRGIRAADALHVATAIAFEADLLVSTDAALLALDGALFNQRGVPIRCCDSDAALALL